MGGIVVPTYVYVCVCVSVCLCVCVSVCVKRVLCHYSAEASRGASLPRLIEKRRSPLYERGTQTRFVCGRCPQIQVNIMTQFDAKATIPITTRWPSRGGWFAGKACGPTGSSGAALEN